MDYSNIDAKRQQFASRKNDSKERVYEFEFYAILKTVLDCIDSFDTGVRKIDLESDVRHLANRLETACGDLRGNIKYLKSR